MAPRPLPQIESAALLVALHLSVAPLRPGEARRNSFPLHTLKGPTSSKKPIFNPGSTCAGRFRLDDALKASAHVVSFIELSTIAHVPISALQSSTTIAVVVTHALVKYTFSQLTFSKSVSDPSLRMLASCSRRERSPARF